MDNSNPPRDKLRPTTDNDWSYHIINIIILVWLCYIYIHIQFFCILIILYVMFNKRVGVFYHNIKHDA